MLFRSPEFRESLDALQGIELIQSQFNSADYFRNFFLSSLPSFVLEPIGIKKELFQAGALQSSGWILAKYLRGNDITGIRTGSLVEIYLYFGFFGVFIFYFFIGRLFGFLDRKLFQFEINEPSLLYYSFITILLSYSWIGVIDNMGYRFWYVSYFYLFALMVASKKNQIIKARNK